MPVDENTDIRDNSYNSIAAGFAAYCASYDAMRILLDSSYSLLDIASCAYLKRVKIVVNRNLDSVHHRTEHGNTVLHVIGCWLHDEPEYDTCESLFDCLLLAGADIKARNNKNQTPEQFNLANGFESLAEILSDYS